MTTKRKRSSNEEIPFKQLKLKDKSSSINVALWRDLATTPIEKGNYVHLKIFYKTSTFDSKKEDQVPVLSNSTNKSAVLVRNFQEYPQVVQPSKEAQHNY